LVERSNTKLRLVVGWKLETKMNEYTQFTDWHTPGTELERRSQETRERIWRETEARRQHLIAKYETRGKSEQVL
jgi:hypothetical protein